MDKNTEIDNKKLNQVLRVSSKVLKNLYVFIIIASIYLILLILGKLNVMNILITILKILSPLFIGIIIAWLLRPLIKWLTNKKMNRIVAVIVVYIIILFVCYLLFSTFIPIFIREVNEFMSIVPSLLDDGVNLLDKIGTKIGIDIAFIKDETISSISEYAMSISKTIPNTVVNAFSSITSILLGLIIGFYLLIYDTKNIDINKYIKKDTYDLLMDTNNILRSYVKGVLLSSLLIFILSSIIFYAIGLNGALLFGFICGITNIIPLIGPYIGGVIPVLVAFTKGIGTGILTTILLVIIQTIEGNIIHPIIMSKSIKVHPVTVIISLLVFGYFFGIVGMIISTPLIAILREFYFYSVKRYNSYKRSLVR